MAEKQLGSGPSNTKDAATKAYVDSKVVSGGGMELQHDFTDDANGAPTTADTGQAFTLSYTSAPAAPTVSSAVLINNDTGASGSAGLIGVTLGASAVYMEADFSIGAVGSGTTNFGTLVIQAFATATPAGTISSLPDCPCFVQCTATGLFVQKWVSGVSTSLTCNQTGTTSITYATAPGTARQHVEVVIDQVNSTIYVRAADGNIYSYTDSFIGTTTAKYASLELSYSNASTDKRVAVYTWGATSSSLYSLSGVNTRAKNLWNEGRLLSTEVTLTGTQTLTNKTLTAPTVTAETLGAGTTTAAPLKFTAGTNLTTAAAGAVEYDGSNIYYTNDTSHGRGLIPVEQNFHLSANGATIGATIANFFGATSNISLVSGGEYIIEIECYFTNATAGTVTWTFTNSSTPNYQNIYYKASVASGIAAPAGSAVATYLEGNIAGDATAVKALTATASLTTTTTQYAYFKIRLSNGTGTSLKIQATKSAGSITPLKGSYWRAIRVPSGNIGTFAA